MKRVLILLFLLMTPLVSAQDVNYYPDETAFLQFLTSKASYTVIAGNETWAEAWAYYVDERLATIKPRGNETLVLVGNVKNNALIASIWNQTGLSPRDSFIPMVIVINNTLLITGSGDNIYLTERAFNTVWNPTLGSMMATAMATILIILAFLLILGFDRSHAESFYLIVISLLFLWYLTSEKPDFTEGFLRTFFSALEFSVGGSPSSPLSTLMGVVFRLIPPVEENIVFIHWLLILLISSLSFLLAPKRSRELGFLIFGLTFSSPMFRESISHISGNLLGITALTLTLVIINNVTFSPSKGWAFLQTLALSGVTLVAVAINPYLVLIPAIYAITFPKRYLRNYSYLIITALGVVYLHLQFDHFNGFLRVSPAISQAMKTFLLQSALAITTTLYAIIERKRLTLKGQTAFLLLLTLLYLPLASMVPRLLPYCFVMISALTVRLIHGITS